MVHGTAHIKSALKPGRGVSPLSYFMTGLMFAAMAWPAAAPAIDIADYPLELASKAAPPVVMVVLDDSSSMDLEFITPENDGTFEGNGYIFPANPGDNVIKTPSTYMTEEERKSWKSQWHGYNALYYNPKTTYTPWPAPDGLGFLPDADTARPRSNPMNPSPTLALDGVYLAIPVRGTGNPEIIRNAHYYVLDDRNSNKREDPGEGLFLISMSGEGRDVFRVSDNDNDGRVDEGELIRTTLSQIPEPVRPGPGLSEDLANFANWYSFYRRRSLAAKAAVGRVLSDLSGISVGFYSINTNLVQNALPVRVTGRDGTVSDKSPDLLSRLYRMKSQGSTPLREGLDAVGRYYQGLKPGGLGPSPYAPREDGGECQRVYSLVMTDGYWTETSFSLPRPDPDTDGHGNTLADVAITYFLTDLRPDLKDLLFPLECDTAIYQHMVTFTVSFGLSGTLKPEDYMDDASPCQLKNRFNDPPAWPDPYCQSCSAKIDDLWHASSNTFGSHFSASNPENLTASLQAVFNRIRAMESSASPITAASQSFFSSTTVFQAFYDSSDWSGDLEARKLYYDPDTQRVSIAPDPLWRAGEILLSRSAESRNIIGFDGKKAVSFTWDELSDTQKSQLNNDPELLSYLRGNPNPRFRKRKGKLGDIVHASPHVIGNHLYVGANDGMLHVFNAASGEEAFAYVPNLVFPDLARLADKLYAHRCFVDQTPACSDIRISGKDKIWLVGGLGKGGKGYFCLDITEVDRMGSFSPDNLKQLVQWEFKDEEGLGYTFSEPVIVRTKSPQHEYVVIFGNGYGCKDGFSRLYIVDAITGQVIRNLSTERGDGNGMSSPIVTDVNNDGMADFVYAGDLKGHIWKWSLEAYDPLLWDFSFRDRDSKPAPLFSTAEGQPVTTRPDVMRHPNRHGYMVCFGTGKYLGVSDLGTENIQAVYGIWDYGDDPGEYLGAFNAETGQLSNHPDQGASKVRLSPQLITAMEDEDGLPVWRTVSKHPVRYDTIPDVQDSNPNQRLKKGLPNPVRDAGWYLDLTASERVHQNVRIRNNVLIVLTRLPSPVPCRGGGSSLVYALDPATGGMVDKAACVDTPSPVNEPLIISTPDGDHLVYDKTKSAFPFPNGGVRQGIYFWRRMF